MSVLEELHSRMTDFGGAAVGPDVAAGLSVARLAVLDERASYAGNGNSVNQQKAVQRTMNAFGRIQSRLERELESAVTYGGTKFGYQSGIAAAIRCVIEVREEFRDEAVERSAA